MGQFRFSAIRALTNFRTSAVGKGLSCSVQWTAWGGIQVVAAGHRREDCLACASGAISHCHAMLTRMNRLLFWAATLGWFLNTSALAHPAARLAKVDAEGVLRWQGDGAEVALFGVNYYGRRPSSPE